MKIIITYFQLGVLSKLLLKTCPNIQAYSHYRIFHRQS